MNGHPSPPPPVEPRGFFEGIAPLPIVIGALVDHLSTLLLGVVLLGILVAGQGAGTDQAEEVLDALAREPALLAAWMLLGSFCTGLGGFAAARLARRQQVQHGAFVGLAGIAFGLLSYAAQPAASQQPLWFDLLGFGMLVPAGALGGWLAARIGSPSLPSAGDDEPEP